MILTRPVEEAQCPCAILEITIPTSGPLQTSFTGVSDDTNEGSVYSVLVTLGDQIVHHWKTTALTVHVVGPVWVCTVSELWGSLIEKFENHCTLNGTAP